MSAAKTVVKVGALGAGAYLLWRQFGGALTGGSSSGSSTPVATDTKQRVLAAATAAGYGADPRLSADQWNWFYTEVRGIPGPDPLQVGPGRDRSYQMSVDEWWTGVSGAGFSGLGQTEPWLLPDAPQIGPQAPAISPSSWQIYGQMMSPTVPAAASASGLDRWLQENQLAVYAGAGALLLLAVTKKR